MLRQPHVIDFRILGADGVEYVNTQPHRIPKPFKRVSVEVLGKVYEPIIPPQHGQPIGFDASIRGLCIDGVDKRWWRMCAIYPNLGLFTTLVDADGSINTLWESMDKVSLPA